MAIDRNIEEPIRGPLTKGDGQGIGPTLGEDVSVEHERREIERAVFKRRDQPEGEAAEPKDAGEGETYEPSDVEVNRGRTQGLGMGEKDLDRQGREGG